MSGFRVILFILLVSGFQFSFCQQINVYKIFGGYRFEKDSVAISPKMVLTLMQTNTTAYDEFKKAHTYYNVMGIMKFAGAAMVLVPVATAIAGGDPEWGLAAGGMVLILGSIPLNLSFQRHAVNALDIYNGSLSRSSRLRINFLFTGTGARLKIRF